MDIVGLIASFAEHSDPAMLVTDRGPGLVGPTIFHANPIFSRMSRYASTDVLDGSPRRLQGSGTNRLVATSVARDLYADGRFHGVLRKNHRRGQIRTCARVMSVR